MECFRIDEGGYTGFDLLNQDQPFQGASAIAISDSDAARLIKDYFPRMKAQELKYKALSRRSGNHPQLLALIQELLKNYKSVTYVCDKRFLLILMFLDHVIEPFYYERGIDFYENGQNFAAGSLLARAGPTLLGEDTFSCLLINFQRAVKEKTPESINSLVAAARKTQWQQLPELLGPLVQGHRECFSEISSPTVSTDAAIVVLQSIISRLEVISHGPYSVEHDRSENLLRYHKLLQDFIAHDQEVEFRQSEIASIKFPLKLVGVTQVDSKLSPSVQLADVMIGAAIEAASSLIGLRSGGLDPKVLLSLYSEEQFIHLVPSIDFEEQRKFREGSQAHQMINYFSKNFFGTDRV